eukprot:8412605-Alexandrium_andersonii.AAC.1
MAAQRARRAWHSAPYLHRPWQNGRVVPTAPLRRSGAFGRRLEEGMRPGQTWSNLTSPVLWTLG